jgi:RNA-directed DNA polymerase
MYVAEESDSGIVPMNHLNKIEQSMAESEEGRPLIEENTHQASTRPTQSGARASQGLAGVRRAGNRFAASHPR